MRKGMHWMTVCLVVILMASLAITGCAKPPPTPAPAPPPAPAPAPKPPPAPTPPPVPKPLVIGGAVAGSAKHMRTELMAKAIRKQLGWEAYVMVGPTTLAETGLMAEGKLHLSMDGIIPILTAAKEGHIGGVPLPVPIKLSVLAVSNVSPVLLYLFEDYPADSISQIIREKHPIKLAIGRKGSSPGIAGELVLKGYGITPEDIEDWGGKIVWEPGTRGAGMMGDGLIDGVLYKASVPYAAITKLATVRSLKALPVTEPEVVEKLAKFGFIPAVIPTGTYDFMPEPQPTVGSTFVVFAPVDMHEETAYQIAKAIWEEREFLFEAYKGGWDLDDPEEVSDWLKAIDKLEMFHPGAAKYWREQGML